LGSVVAEDGRASADVNVRMQKARGSFSKCRKVWLFKSIRIDTKIRILNACVKSVLLYGCETWLVKVKFGIKYKLWLIDVLNTYILRIWWPNIISNKDYGKQQAKKMYI
jgi:hypothetical protein